MTLRHKAVTIAVAFLLASVHASSSSANTIDLRPFIANASFESPVTTCCNFPNGWSQGGTATGDEGNWEPPAGAPLAGLIALDGSQVGYINNYSGQDGFENYRYLSQTLDTVTFALGDTYTLTYAVARRADTSDPAAFRVQINGNYDASLCPSCFSVTTGSTGAFVPGAWNYSTVSYTAQLQDVGTHPTIFLVNDGRIDGPGLAQVQFDFAVPDGGSTALLLGAALCGFAAVRRKFNTK